MKFRNKKTGEIKEWGPVLINSALLSAQQRKRYYWTNWHVEQPQDKGILLKDILESRTGCTAEHYAQKICNTPDKANTLMARDYKGFGNQRTNGVLEPVVYQDKAHCLDANYYKGASLEHTLTKHKRTQVFEPVGAAMRTREDGNGQEKSNAITSVQTDSMVCEPMRIGELDGLGKGQANRIYSVRGKSVCLNANGGGGGAKTGLYKVDLPDGDYIIRKLTPVECARLQTMPDHWCDGISATQQYKCLGNGWTVDVIAHILKQIPNN